MIRLTIKKCVCNLKHVHRCVRIPRRAPWRAPPPLVGGGGFSSPPPSPEGIMSSTTNIKAPSTKYYLDYLGECRFLPYLYICLFLYPKNSKLINLGVSLQHFNPQKEFFGYFSWWLEHLILYKRFIAFEQTEQDWIKLNKLIPDYNPLFPYFRIPVLRFRIRCITDHKKVGKSQGNRLVCTVAT